jgi:hypothetical protein
MNMTVSEMAKLLETTMLLGDGKGLRFVVRIYDVRESWGKTQCLVAPTHGDGERWVGLESLSAIG